LSQLTSDYSPGVTRNRKEPANRRKKAARLSLEALGKFGEAAETDPALWGVAVMAFSAMVNVLVSRYLYRVGQETASIALKADAAHLSTYVMTSVGVLVGLG
jgi:divalent metal cation (Fe/Co/Zn/Cd) transporter